MKIKDFIKKIKNNLSLIILAPALLGGLWQILELSRMSISYIRFFSPTQLLPDGLLILFMALILYSIYFVLTYKKSNMNFKFRIINIGLDKPISMNGYFIKRNTNNKLSYIDNPIYKKSIQNIVMNIIIIVFHLFFYLSIFLYLYSASFLKFDFTNIVVLFVLSVFFIRHTSLGFIKLIVIFYQSKVYTDNIIIKLLIKDILAPVVFMVLFFLLVAFILYIPSFIHRNYTLPENLKNLNNIKDSLESKNYKKNNILYFNDKYIFIEHSNDEKNTTIEIIKFDELFKA